jgi:hypothetical protein
MRVLASAVLGALLIVGVACLMLAWVIISVHVGFWLSGGDRGSGLLLSLAFGGGVPELVFVSVEIHDAMWPARSSR